MRFMLEKNFDGRHFWVRANEGVIDAMFFPSTNEKVLLKDEIKDG
jgi:hypothetical protein